MDIELKKEIIPGAGHMAEETVLTLTEHNDTTMTVGRLNPFYCLQFKQGEFLAEITFNSKQGDMARQIFEELRNLDDDAFCLDVEGSHEQELQKG